MATQLTLRPLSSLVGRQSALHHIEHFVRCPPLSAASPPSSTSSTSNTSSVVLPCRPPVCPPVHPTLRPLSSLVGRQSALQYIELFVRCPPSSAASPPSSTSNTSSVVVPRRPPVRPPSHPTLRPLSSLVGRQSALQYIQHFVRCRPSSAASPLSSARYGTRSAARRDFPSRWRETGTGSGRRRRVSTASNFCIPKY